MLVPLTVSVWRFNTRVNNKNCKRMDKANRKWKILYKCIKAGSICCVPIPPPPTCCTHTTHTQTQTQTHTHTDTHTPTHTRIPLDEDGELDPDGVAALADADGLQHAWVAELVHHHLLLELHGGLGRVGLHAPHKVRVAPAANTHTTFIYLFIEGLQPSQPAQGHFRAFHKFKSHTKSWIYLFIYVFIELIAQSNRTGSPQGFSLN